MPINNAKDKRWLSKVLDSHLHVNFFVWIVANELEILQHERIDVLLCRVDLQGRKVPRRVAQLLLQGLHVVCVDVGVPHHVHKLTRLQVADLGHHAGEQRVGGDVEGHPQAYVARALVHKAGQLAMRHEKLAKHVAGRQRHVSQGCGVPSGEQQAAVVGVGFDARDEVCQLVHTLACVVGVHVLVLCSKVPPLEAVHWPQVTFLPVIQANGVQVLAGGVAVPDVDVLVLQISGVGTALHKPQQLLCYATPKGALGGEQRESMAQVEAHRAAKASIGAGARAIWPVHASLNDVLDQLQVLKLIMPAGHGTRQQQLIDTTAHIPSSIPSAAGPLHRLHAICGGIAQERVPGTLLPLRLAGRPQPEARRIDLWEGGVTLYILFHQS
mmetsp:Transcript_27304/g.73803  ORF Transcript_27304/g.73803 Transcript_27304/m.73803 type:complete len:383 (+) Transcript_27304:427-1575(+)